MTYLARRQTSQPLLEIMCRSATVSGGAGDVKLHAGGALVVPPCMPGICVPSETCRVRFDQEGCA